MDETGARNLLSNGNHSFSTSASLIGRLKARQPQAWTRLVDLYGPLIYHWARRAGLSSEDAADIVQDVLEAVWTRMDRFRYESPEDTFRGWLWTITKRKIVDHYRSQGKLPSARGGTDAQVQMQQVCGPEFLSSDPDEAGGLTALVQRALEVVRHDFSDGVWKAFVLTALQHHSSVEAADQLDMSPGAVRQAKFRVLRRLREELGEIE